MVSIPSAHAVPPPIGVNVKRGKETLRVYKIATLLFHACGQPEEEEDVDKARGE